MSKPLIKVVTPTSQFLATWESFCTALKAAAAPFMVHRDCFPVPAHLAHSLLGSAEEFERAFAGHTSRPAHASFMRTPDGLRIEVRDEM